MINRFRLRSRIAEQSTRVFDDLSAAGDPKIPTIDLRGRATRRDRATFTTGERPI